LYSTVNISKTHFVVQWFKGKGVSNH